MSTNGKLKIATTWLDGCSGCHMSFLDIDENIVRIANLADIVYGPLVDFKEIPDGIDVALIEGAVANEEDREKAIHLRAKSKLVVAFGDCAVTGNVPTMRNWCGATAVLDRAYNENVDEQPGVPYQVVPGLLPMVLPLKEVIKVDFHLPGCPPSADLILETLKQLCAGRMPQLTSRFCFG